MNSDKQSLSRQRGNVMIYILIALGLIGALTVAMTRQGDQSSGENLDKETVQLYTTRMISYTGAAQNVVNQMIMSGTTLDSLSLVNPTSSGFNTAPHIHKLFHPSGGGLSYEIPQLPPFVDSTSGTEEGWYATKRNIEWTPSINSDAVMAAYGISLDVCKEINKKITGTSATVPLTSGETRTYFTNFAASNLTAAICAGCDGYPSLCVTDPDGIANPTYYTILEAR